MDEKTNLHARETSVVASHKVLDQLRNQLSDKPPALLCIGADAEDSILDLKPGEMTLGRSTDNHLVIEAHSISRSHFKLTTSEDLETVILEDLQSRNGTLVNGVRVEKAVRLQTDDVITAGSLVFKFLPRASPERELFKQLQLRANTDGLTRCFNRQYLFDVMERELGKQKGRLNALCMIVMDIDHFKDINDAYGHDAGDHILKSMATLIWHHEIREIDLFARYGGEEFVILLFRTGLDETYRVAERIRGAIERHSFHYGDEQIRITASMGVAGTDGSVSDPNQLFRLADAALYESKKQGRNRTTIYSSGDAEHGELQ